MQIFLFTAQIYAKKTRTLTIQYTIKDDSFWNEYFPNYRG